MSLVPLRQFELSTTLKCSNNVLRDIYKPLGRCVCLIDENVETIYGREISTYFEYHNISLEKLVYRAMEIDKGIDTVEICWVTLNVAAFHVMNRF